jgi:hypothetical protein
MPIDPFSSEYAKVVELGAVLRKRGFATVDGQRKAIDVGATLAFEKTHNLSIDQEIAKQPSNDVGIAKNEPEHERESKVALQGEKQLSPSMTKDLQQHYGKTAKQLRHVAKVAGQELEKREAEIDPKEKEGLKETIDAANKAAKVLQLRTAMKQDRMMQEMQKIAQKKQEIKKQMEEEEKKKKKKEKLQKQNDKFSQDGLNDLAAIFLPELFSMDNDKEKSKDKDGKPKEGTNLLKEAIKLGKQVAKCGAMIAEGLDSSSNRLVGKQQEHEPVTDMSMRMPGGKNGGN